MRRREGRRGTISALKKKINAIKQNKIINLSPANYTQVISGYFVNIKDPLVPVFLRFICILMKLEWLRVNSGVIGGAAAAELQRRPDESGSLATTWLKRMSRGPLCNRFLGNN